MDTYKWMILTDDKSVTFEHSACCVELVIKAFRRKYPDGNMVLIVRLGTPIPEEPIS